MAARPRDQLSDLGSHRVYEPLHIEEMKRVWLMILEAVNSVGRGLAGAGRL